MNFARKTLFYTTHRTANTMQIVRLSVRYYNLLVYLYLFCPSTSVRRYTAVGISPTAQFFRSKRLPRG